MVLFSFEMLSTKGVGHTSFGEFNGAVAPYLVGTGGSVDVGDFNVPFK